MRKRLLSLLFAVVLLASVVTVGVSAATDGQNHYVHTDTNVSTRRVWFYMPSDWYNEFSAQTGDTAGIYWWGGTGALDVWCGYRAYADSEPQMFYMDLPADAPMIIWNNYVNGEMDTEAPIYKAALQTIDIQSEGICEDDDSIYLEQEGFWEEMKESFNGDKSALGNFVDTFEDNNDYGFMLNLDNMIYILDDNTKYANPSALSGKLGYSGQWYFYFGDGKYGSWPTPERSQEEMEKGNGFFGELKYTHTPLAETGFKEVDGETYFYYMASYIPDQTDDVIFYGQRAKNGFFSKDGKIYYAQENGNLLKNAERSFTEAEAVDIYGNRVEGLTAGEVYSFDADGSLQTQGGVIVDEPTEPPTDAPTDAPTQAPTKAADTQATDGTQKENGKATPDAPTTPKSSTNSNANTTNKSAIQTGDVVYAIALLTILALAAGVVFFVRRKRFN